MPIIMCSGKRKGKVAKEMTDKGYCSTKSMYYFGVKLHVLGFARANQMPYPESIIVTPASKNDLPVFKENWADIEDRTFFGDKIYIDKPFFDKLEREKNSKMLTPIKQKKGQSDLMRQHDKAYNDIFSKAVSTIRQPIESFLNFLIEVTGIQKASKVRSSKGLINHIFGKISAAFLYLIF